MYFDITVIVFEYDYFFCKLIVNCYQWNKFFEMYSQLPILISFSSFKFDNT